MDTLFSNHDYFGPSLIVIYLVSPTSVKMGACLQPLLGQPLLATPIDSQL